MYTMTLRKIGVSAALLILLVVAFACAAVPFRVHFR